VSEGSGESTFLISYSLFAIRFATDMASSRILTAWYGLVLLAGFLFGLLGERRPFGDGFFAHPLVALFIIIGIGLIALRVVLARPVPEIIPERPLLIGCFVALAAFLAGNFVSTHLLAVMR
jgi:hypothetical protein